MKDFHLALSVALEARDSERERITNKLREFISKSALELDEFHDTLSYEDQRILGRAYDILSNLHLFIRELEE